METRMFLFSSRNLRQRYPLIAGLVALLAAAPAQARLMRLVIEKREPLASAGQPVGPAGAYERLTGRFYGELDWNSPTNRIINDIGFATRNVRDHVEYSATFTLLRPVDPSKTSGVLWYEVPNRGSSPLTRPSADALAAGHILLSSGWQGDLTPSANLETITVPVAHNRDGSPITGPVLYRISNVRGPSASLEAGYAGLHYQRPLTIDTTKALLTKQASDESQVIPIASSEWSFGNCENTPFPGSPDPTHICLKGGFDPDLLYQVVYTAKDPLVLGIGLAATRDINAFLRYAEKDNDGTPNPVAGLVKHSIAFGTSQSGNFLKTFVHLGFNADEVTGEIVWDGMNPNIAARQNPINFRFAIPGGATGVFEPGSEGVLWWSPYVDQDARGRPSSSLLDRCRNTRINTNITTCPKIIETFGSSEFWGLRMSPRPGWNQGQRGHSASRQRPPVLLSRGDSRRRVAVDSRSLNRVPPAGAVHCRTIRTPLPKRCVRYAKHSPSGWSATPNRRPAAFPCSDAVNWSNPTEPT